MSTSKPLRLFCVLLLFFSGNASGFLKNIGRGAAKEASIGLQNTAKILGDSLLQASARLEAAMRIGSDAVRETVAQLMVPVTELVKNIEFRINSGDLAHIGADATANLKDAIIQLSKNWNLAIDTADLESIGAEAAKHLSDAMQNMNLRIKVDFSIDENTKDAIGYIAAAGGFAFAVLFIAILLSLRSCRSCCREFCIGSAEGFDSLFFFVSDDDDASKDDGESDLDLSDHSKLNSSEFIKLNNLEVNGKVNNLLVKVRSTSY